MSGLRVAPAGWARVTQLDKKWWRAGRRLGATPARTGRTTGWATEDSCRRTVRGWSVSSLLTPRRGGLALRDDLLRRARKRQQDWAALPAIAAGIPFVRFGGCQPRDQRRQDHLLAHGA